ncbi:hypothetical protein DL763_004895 [Monosporascus cannonballus]|nr:hypothetical protein DL763_004895 [Monosporascus cannonballus]
MAPPTTRSQGGPSSSQPQQQPTPTPKDTIKVQGKKSEREEVEEEIEEKAEKDANQTREGIIPPPSYHGMPDVKGYKPTPPKPYDGSTDVERFLVQQLHLLRQTKSASEYTTKFNRLAAISNLPESALFYPYYDGLKPQVKDEIYIEPKMGSFAKYTDKVIIADRRTFNRYLKKKGTGKRSDNKGSSSRTKKDKGKP